MKTRILALAISTISFYLMQAAGVAQTNTFPSSGNVGIGTTSPVTPLQVAGQVSATNGDRLGWSNFALWYSWDGSNVHYYWNRLYQLPSEGHVTFQVYAKTDVNYPGFGIYTVDATSWNGQSVSLSIIPAQVNKNSLGVAQAAIDSSGYVWVKVPALWDSSVAFKTSYNQGVTEQGSIIYQEAAPSQFIVSETQSMRATFPGLSVTYSAQSAPFIDGSGDVGIGTTNPTAKLEVSGNTQVDGALNVSTSGITFPNGGGTQTTAWTGVLCGGDYAEAVDVKGSRKSYEPGDLLVLSDGNSGEVEKSGKPYSKMVAGIFATKPGVIGRRQELADKAEEVPMAMVGIVPTKVTTENGPIHRGDLLVSSSSPGFAMKGTDSRRLVGAVIGKAMGSLDSGTGVIAVLVTLQ